MTPNCYVGTAAADENEAREFCAETFYVDAADLTLVHVETTEDEEEAATYIFSMCADTSEQEEGEWLYDLYELPNLPNMPCEIV